MEAALGGHSRDMIWVARWPEKERIGLWDSGAEGLRVLGIRESSKGAEGCQQNAKGAKRKASSEKKVGFIEGRRHASC